MKRLALAVLLFAAVACEADPGPRQDWAAAPPARMEFGAPQDLELRRVWPRGWRAQPFDPQAWLPLEVELRARRVRERAGRSEESLQLRVRSWTLGGQLLRLPFAAEEPGVGTTSAAPLVWEFAVTSSLPATDPGAMEWPRALARARSWGPRQLATLGVLLLLVLLGCAWRARPRRARAARRAAPRTDPWAQLRQLAAAPTGNPQECRAVLAALREFLRTLEPGRAWGGEELAARLARRHQLPALEARELQELLADLEAVLFGARPVRAESVERALDSCAAVLREAAARSAEERRA